jgi:chemotaxis protein MotB
MDEPPPKKQPAGAAMWLVTFADLMALLMCFFVLLLSFSEIDVQKYKQVAGSMAKAFGVQRKTVADQAPMGTSFVAREFTPGRPNSRPIDLSVAQTIPSLAPMQRAPTAHDTTEKIAELLKKGLEDEIEDGDVEVFTEEHSVVIRIREKGAFASGQAELLAPFHPTLEKIALLLQDPNFRIIVAGHTDSVPIRTSRFRSNWELSSARAVTVIHALQKATGMAAHHFVLQGYGSVNPIASNDTSEGRALNRRVEIVIRHDASLEQTTQSDSPSTDSRPS